MFDVLKMVNVDIVAFLQHQNQKVEEVRLKVICLFQHLEGNEFVQHFYQLEAKDEHHDQELLQQ